MPNRPICAEDALLSETPMPPEQILRYLDRIGLRTPSSSSHAGNAAPPAVRTSAVCAL
ncbi:MAG: hypothetical protein ACLSBB_06605 [Ruthenibacterium lactatiformans]